MSVDEMNMAPRCEATAKRTGEQCKAAAIRGHQPHRCPVHAGRKLVDIKDERDLREQATKVGARLVREGHPKASQDPLGTALELLDEAEEWRLGLKAEIGSFQSIRDRAANGESVNLRVKLYTEAMDRSARIAVDLVRLGIEDRVVRVEEAKGAMLIEVLLRVLRVTGHNPREAEVAALVRSTTAEVEAEWARRELR